MPRTRSTPSAAAAESSKGKADEPSEVQVPKRQRTNSEGVIPTPTSRSGDCVEHKDGDHDDDNASPPPEKKSKPFNPEAPESGRRWSQQQIEALLYHRQGNMPYNEIAKLLGKTVMACRLALHNHKKKEARQRREARVHGQPQSMDPAHLHGYQYHFGSGPGYMPQQGFSYSSNYDVYSTTAHATHRQSGFRHILPAAAPIPRTGNQRPQPVASSFRATANYAAPAAAATYPGYMSHWNRVASDMGYGHAAHTAHQMLRDGQDIYGQNMQASDAAHEQHGYCGAPAPQAQQHNLGQSAGNDSRGLDALSLAAAQQARADETVSPRTDAPPALPGVNSLPVPTGPRFEHPQPVRMHRTAQLMAPTIEDVTATQESFHHESADNGDADVGRRKDTMTLQSIMN